MGVRARAWLLAVLPAALALGRPALAETGSGSSKSGAAPSPKFPSAGADVGASPAQLRKEVQERMRAIRAYRIVDELKLDESTSARLFPILAKLDDSEMALSAERREIARNLKAEIDSQHPDDARIMKALDQLAANRARRIAVRDQQIREIRKVLTPVQQAKLVLLIPHLEHDFAQLIHDSERGD